MGSRTHSQGEVFWLLEEEAVPRAMEGLLTST